MTDPVNLNDVPRHIQKKIRACFAHIRSLGSHHLDRRVEECHERNGGLVVMKADYRWRVLGWREGTYPDVEDEYPDSVVGGVLWIKAMSHEDYNKSWRTFNKTTPDVGSASNEKAPRPKDGNDPVLTNKEFKARTDLMSAVDAYELLGVNRSTVYNWLDVGVLDEGPTYSVRGPYNGRSVIINDKLEAALTRLSGDAEESPTDAEPTDVESTDAESVTTEPVTTDPAAQERTPVVTLPATDEGTFEALVALTQREVENLRRRSKAGTRLAEATLALEQAKTELDEAKAEAEAIIEERQALYTSLL